MKREEATVIIKNCLEAEYETGKYEKLIANILTTQYQKINSVKPNERVRHAFQDSIDSYTVLGSYKDSGGQKIALLEVHLKNNATQLCCGFFEVRIAWETRCSACCVYPTRCERLEVFSRKDGILSRHNRGENQDKRRTHTSETMVISRGKT